MAGRSFTRVYNGEGNRIKAEYVNELQVALEDDDARIDAKPGLADVQGVVQTELSNNATVVAAAEDAAAAAVPGVLEATDFGPYVGPEVDAHIAADPGFTAAANTAVNDYIATNGVTGAVEADSDDDIAYGRTFSDGSRTFVEFDFDGKPTTWSTMLIRSALGTSMVAPEAVSLTASTNTYRAAPTAAKPLDAPILDFADQSAVSVYWPTFVDRTLMGGSGVSLLYSTDHAATHSDSGIFAAHADSPLGSFTVDGLLYRDDAGGDQTETPSVLWDDAEGHYKVYYQQDDMGTGDQSTLLATTTDLVTFSRVGVVAQQMDAIESGDGHTGYFRPFRIGASWFAWSLYGGAAYPRYALWQSADGVTWYPHPQRIGPAKPFLTSFPGADDSWRQRIFQGSPVLWRGQMWWIGAVAPAGFGTDTNVARIAAAPLSPDLLRFGARLIDITPDAQAWEGVGITMVGDVFPWEGRLFLPYVADGPQGAIGVMEII